MAGKKSQQSNKKDTQNMVVCRNRRARHNYEIVDEVDCGIVLVGSEVKSIRDGRISVDEAFARIERGELFLYNVDISEYAQASYLNHDRHRVRKLLLKKRELDKIAEPALQKGMTLVPLEVFFSRGFVKVKIAVARGRKEYDKREKIKKNQDQKTLREAVRKRV
ncbi:MAG: SsrA-binding protein SmpB [Planctomycetaceae bacterium]|nr:SsrA-binding protein SmpB [Planctomycetaceae bacterium]MCB9949904.1 SsrA-binding protein SmpB [Planctomycetaceae bacterium]